MSLVSRDGVGVKGVRDAKSPERCRFARFRSADLVVPAAGVVASMEWCPTRHVVGATSPCPVEYSCIPGCSDVSNVVVPVD